VEASVRHNRQGVFVEDRAERSGDGVLRIAVPTTGGRLAGHFGQCEQFIVFEADVGKKTMRGSESLDAPPHAPGLLPEWLGQARVDVVIAGGMGRRARDLFGERGIDVVVGAGLGEPEGLVRAYLEGTLRAGPNPCDH
jgi:predicted Fe-Mo cluster-binding NifX family protein